MTRFRYGIYIYACTTHPSCHSFPFLFYFFSFTYDHTSTLFNVLLSWSLPSLFDLLRAELRFELGIALKLSDAVPTEQRLTLTELRPVLWIRIRIGSVFNRASGSGSVFVIRIRIRIHACNFGSFQANRPSV